MTTSDSRNSIVDDLHTWGPILTQELRARFTQVEIQELVRAKVIARKKFTGFEVYVLTGVGLRPYGYSIRYNYVPAKTVVLGALITRAMARKYAADSYAVELYSGYGKRGRANLLLLRRDGKLTVLIGRPSITTKAIRVIVSVLVKTLKIDELITVVLDADHEALLLKAVSINDIPFTLITLPPTQITREIFPSETAER